MLRPDTEQLWNFLRNESALGGFVLVGGTALSMHLNHRISEDLDFMLPAPRLPRAAIEGLKKRAQAHDFNFVANDNPEALLEFEDTGLNYHDYQQDFIVNDRVKVTVVAPDPEVGVMLRSGQPDGPRIASLEEIFRLKCIACANRTKTRDWLDMFVLLQRGLFQPLDIYRTYDMAGVPAKFDIAMGRMCSGKVSLLDEGYESLMPSPPSVAEMQTYFKTVRDEIEVEVARLKALNRRV